MGVGVQEHLQALHTHLDLQRQAHIALQVGVLVSPTGVTAAGSKPRAPAPAQPLLQTKPQMKVAH